MNSEEKPVYSLFLSLLQFFKALGLVYFKQSNQNKTKEDKQNKCIHRYHKLMGKNIYICIHTRK